MYFTEIQGTFKIQINIQYKLILFIFIHLVTQYWLDFVGPIVGQHQVTLCLLCSSHIVLLAFSWIHVQHILYIINDYPILDSLRKLKPQ